mmetsp:Transcript_6593/g.9442  ORF Transcript_6593/g.9442 Transcript_6593/m.9442 type:complete len:1079 (-) Transcript_6593:63-3299(-)
MSSSTMDPKDDDGQVSGPVSVAAVTSTQRSNSSEQLGDSHSFVDEKWNSNGNGNGGRAMANGSDGSNQTVATTISVEEYTTRENGLSDSQITPGRQNILSRQRGTGDCDISSPDRDAIQVPLQMMGHGGHTGTNMSHPMVMMDDPTRLPIMSPERMVTAPITSESHPHMHIQVPSSNQKNTDQQVPVLPASPQQQHIKQQAQYQQQHQPQHQTNGGVVPNSSAADVENDIDSILNSPRPKDEIVEKSPGGRYLRFSEKLGSGAYKDVYRAYDTNEGIEVAWNAVTLSGVPKGERQYIVNEVKLLEKLNHSNIISFHGSWVNRELEQVIFVTEILSSGTLKSFINKVQVIRYKIAKRWAIQILKGLEYLHSQDPPIIHRDLKCDNIFINGTSGDLRIGDLGLSTVISKKSKVLSVLGTPEFMAPELYEEAYDEKVDIYAFGMCMLEIFTKEVPYMECSNPAQIYKKVSSGIEPQSLNRIKSGKAKDFIRQCLGTRDENGVVTRPTAVELLNHPFLAKREDDDSQIKVECPIRERTIIEGPVGGGSDGKHGEGSPPTSMHPDSATNQNNSQPYLRKASAEITYVSSEGNDIIHTTEVSKGPQHLPVAPPALQPSQQSTFGFDAMPDRESNMKPVTTLMGRGQEVEGTTGERELPYSIAPPALRTPLPSTPPPPASFPFSNSQTQLHEPQINSEANSRKSSVDSDSRQIVAFISDNGGLYSSQVDASIFNYLRVAEIMKNNDAPVLNDILQLRITLTLNNEDQQVQFEFHLIEDDPVQVAREMVSELHLPQDAILEISETISGVARQARIRQEQYKTSVGPNALGVVSPTESLNQSTEEFTLLNIPPPLPAAGHTNALPPPPPILNDLPNDNIPPSHAPLQVITEPAQNNNFTSSIEENHIQLQTMLGVDFASNPSLNSNTDQHTRFQEDSSAIFETTEIEDDDDDELINSSEFKKLKIEHEKKKQRAQKAYNTRMENLQRSSEEKEAQHQKTLVKHEKEKAALAKRQKLAEAEQHQRLQKMDAEFVQQRAIAKKKVSVQPPPSSDEEASTSTTNIDENQEARVQAPSPTASMDGSNKSSN